MNALVIGSGGREHALVKALARSPKIKKIFAAPGNPGMVEAECVPIPADHIADLIPFAHKEKIDLTLVGPEAPLVQGIVDQFEKAGLRIFGANQAAAILEGSKVFTKNFLKKYRIPTAAYQSFGDFESAKKFLRDQGDREWVVKVDGLAAGKGVFVSRTPEATLQALEEVFVKKGFGEQAVVLEEFLDGEELSFMAVCDGERGFPLATSQDHKRLLDGDEGPNTGGMGAYSPAPLMTPELHERVMNEIISPTLKGMKAEGRPFKGLLYAGLMVVGGDPYVLEFNVRFGDPEAQVILPRLESDWVDLFIAATEGRLDQVRAVWQEASAVVIVLAARGYPASPQKGDEISGLDEVGEEVIVYHAGTAKKDGRFVTAGGRVLGVTALGKNLRSAVDKAYAAVNKIHFQGMQFRKDIAAKGLKRDLHG